jgi:hypothetical protein
MQLVPITTEIVSLKPVHGEVYSIQHYLVKFVTDLQQVSGFLRALWCPQLESYGQFWACGAQTQWPTQENVSHRLINWRDPPAILLKAEWIIALLKPTYDMNIWIHYSYYPLKWEIFHLQLLKRTSSSHLIKYNLFSPWYTVKPVLKGTSI